jgi:hypothetical protein
VYLTDIAEEQGNMFTNLNRIVCNAALILTTILAKTVIATILEALEGKTGYSGALLCTQYANKLRVTLKAGNYFHLSDCYFLKVSVPWN